MGIEFRLADVAPAAKGDKLNGMAAPFNSTTMIGRAPFGFRETIKPTAWNNTIKNGDQVLLDNHDSARPIARVSAGTMEVHAGRRGAMWEATPADTTYAQDVVKNVRAQNYGGCSFSFEVVSDTWDYETDDDIPLRTLNEINVREISVVTFPAYTDTTVSLRDVESAGWDAFNAWYERELLGGTEEQRAASDNDADDKKPYGNVTYADPKNGKYPVDTAAHAKAAWSYINQGKNAAKYPLNGVSLSSVKDKIKSACKKFGIKVAGDSGKNSELIVVEARDGLRISFDSDMWNEKLRELYLNEEKWIELPSENSENPPSLTREEIADLSARAAQFRQEQYAQRKAQMAKEGK